MSSSDHPSRDAGRCERCGNVRPGAEYDFWYGSIVEESSIGGVTAYTLGGHGAAFICDQCIEDRMRRNRRLLITVLPICSLVFLGIGLGYWLTEDEVGALLALGGMAVLVGPVLLPLVLWAMRRKAHVGRKAVGWLLATQTPFAKELRKQGHSMFWTTEQFEEMAATARRVEPAAGHPAGADYSFVRDGAGTVTGVWLRNPAQAGDQNLLMALLMKHNLSPASMMAGVRVVPNRQGGGSFVMFGDARAPGET